MWDKPPVARVASEAELNGRWDALADREGLRERLAMRQMIDKAHWLLGEGEIFEIYAPTEIYYVGSTVEIHMKMCRLRSTHRKSTAMV